MRIRQSRILASVILTVVSNLGCRSPAAPPNDPFTATPQSIGNAAGSTSGNTSQVTPVSYEASAQNSAPGTSLNGEFEEAQPSWWARTSKAFTAKEAKKNYKALVGRYPDESVAREAYNKGDALFREGKYDEAAKQFTIAVDRWPDSLLEEDAMYMLGESYFFADRYHKARNTFEELIAKYENSRHLDRITVRQFALGRFWDEIGRDKYMLAPNFTDKTRPWFDTHGHGVKVYEHVRLSDPTGPLADDATMAQATSYFIDSRYDDAAFQYEILRKDYPQSEHQKQAHLLGLQSYLNAYQGPQYDRTPLSKADTLAESTLRNLGHQMPEEKPRLYQAQELIRAQIAERDFDLGEYYRRLGYNRAARKHYGIVMRDYPDTKFAELATQRMQETENLPPEPPDYFPWLTKWLGTP